MIKYAVRCEGGCCAKEGKKGEEGRKDGRRKRTEGGKEDEAARGRRREERDSLKEWCIKTLRLRLKTHKKNTCQRK